MGNFALPFCHFFPHYIRVKKFFCEDISVEFEFKSEKFKGCVDLLEVISNLDLSGNTTEFKTFTAKEFSIHFKMFVLLKYSTGLIRITLHGSVLSASSFH